MSKKKTIEETYQKLTQREHILKRPDTYIGSIKKQMEELWVPNEEFKMEKRMLEYSPGFIKIFDEVLTNATDHSFRYPEVTQIKIDYNKDTGEITVFNNGPGIPIELHKEHNIYVPELIFGHLLTGSNYSDSDVRTGAGRNGYGSKLCSIFSKNFTVETADSNSEKKFVQEHSENMTIKSKPKITSYKKSSDIIYS
jgi:DNA topoisomerase-2